MAKLQFTTIDNLREFLTLHNVQLNKIAARWPAKAVAQFYFY